MRNLFVAMILPLLLISCKHLETADLFYPDGPEQIIEESAGFTVRVSQVDLDNALDPDKFFLNMARQECFVRTARKVLEVQPLLQASYNHFPPEPFDFFQFKGQLNPERIPFTDDLVQDFQCTLKIHPYFSLAGKIVGLEEEKTMSASGDKITLVLFSELPLEMPSYFVIGRGTTRQHINLVNIFGSGRITRSVVSKEPGNDKLPGRHVLAQGVIMEGNHEVLQDDLVFLAYMDMTALELSQETEQIAVPPSSDVDEVWVRPEIREPEAAPSEMK